MGDDSESVFEKIYNGLQPLSTLNADNLQGLAAISGIIGGLAGSLERLSDIDYGDVKSSVKDLGKILAFTIPMLDAASKGTVIGEGILMDIRTNFVQALRTYLRALSTKSIRLFL